MRRVLLDRALDESAHLLTGKIVDIGGEAVDRRGWSEPRRLSRGNVIVLNIDRSAAPDVVADCQRLPLRDRCADAVVLTEVLEHVPHPDDVLAETRRVLVPEGVLICSVPFLFPVHGDPDDYRRFTASGLRVLLEGFDVESARPLGGWMGTLGLLLEGQAEQWRRSSRRWVVRKGLRLVARLARGAELSLAAGSDSSVIHTGMFVVARKTS